MSHALALPLWSREPEARRRGMSAKLDLHGIVVLVVDDHEDTLEMMKVLVESLGARVHLARDGQQALRVARRVKPHVILSDINMPHMDGLELVRRVRTDTTLCRVPVIAVSGRDGHSGYMESRAAGFDGHLVKPVTRDLLETHLARIFWPRAEQGPD
jgi:two-component system, chemotaxis family, CheB/CheR fusion protein